MPIQVGCDNEWRENKIKKGKAANACTLKIC